MSLAFNDTSTLKGIAQIYEQEIGVNQGDITGNTAKMKAFTADVNLAWDDYVSIAIQSSGQWQFDDSNHTDYPIIQTNLVANQRDYTFTTDQQGNLILDIYKVLIADTNGVFTEITPVDVNQPKPKTRGSDGFSDGQNTTGTPKEYDKLGNGIFLDPIPNYSVTNGLKIYINREASYFTYTDTTKKPGCPGIHHEYFALKPALKYALRHNHSNAQALQQRVTLYERDIKLYFSLRDKDTRKGIRPLVESNE